MEYPSGPLKTMPSTTNACEDLVRTFPLRDSPLGRKRTPRTSHQQAGQSQGQPHGQPYERARAGQSPSWLGQATVRTSVGERRLAYVTLLRYRLYLPSCAYYRAIVKIIYYDRVAQELSYNIKAPSSSSSSR